MAKELELARYLNDIRKNLDELKEIVGNDPLFKSIIRHSYESLGKALDLILEGVEDPETFDPPSSAAVSETR